MLAWWIAAATFGWLVFNVLKTEFPRLRRMGKHIAGIARLVGDNTPAAVFEKDRLMHLCLAELGDALRLFGKRTIKPMLEGA